MKIIFSLFILGWLALPTLVLAQSAAENINVELKVPLPFVRTNCFVTDQDGKRVKDLSGNEIPAVCSLKDYIEGVYRFIIGAGAIFAVVMIIIAGYQWMLSGGSADKTGAAKKRMWNASIGLVLALLSYIILNAISARLVELHLPEVDPVPPFFSGAGIFCATDPNIEKLYKASTTDRPHFFLEVGSGEPGFDKDETLCGKRYTLAGNSGQCLGNVCRDKDGRVDPKQTCVDGRCGSTLIYGNIEWHPDNGYVDYIRLKPVCGGALMEEVGHVDVPEKGRAYVLSNDFKEQVQVTEFSTEQAGPAVVEKPVYQIRIDDCVNNKREKLKGFVLEVEVNNDCYRLTTKDTDFALGNNNAMPIQQGSVYDPDDIDWNMVPAADLIPLADLKAGALQYNLVINRINFPVPLQSSLNTPTSCPTQ